MDFYINYKLEKLKLIFGEIEKWLMTPEKYEKKLSKLRGGREVTIQNYKISLPKLIIRETNLDYPGIDIEIEYIIHEILRLNLLTDKVVKKCIRTYFSDHYLPSPPREVNWKSELTIILLENNFFQVSRMFVEMEDFDSEYQNYKGDTFFHNLFNLFHCKEVYERMDQEDEINKMIDFEKYFNMTFIFKIMSNIKNINLKNNDGDNLFSKISEIRDCDETLIKTLVKLGCDINSENKYGMTPLLKAEKYGNYKTSDLLLENGADFFHKGKDIREIPAFDFPGGRKRREKELTDYLSKLEERKAKIKGIML